MDSITIDKVREFISSCEVKRLEQLDEEFENSKEYSVLSEEITILYDELKSAIPENLVSLLNNYDDLLGDMMFAKQCFYYKHGFIDATVIFDTLFAGKKNVNLNIKFL